MIGLRRSDWWLAPLVTSALVSMAVSQPAAGQGGSPTASITADAAGIGYSGTDADTNLLIMIGDGNTRIANYGDEVWGEVVGCEHFVDKGVEWADCPTAPRITLWLEGATSENRVFFEYQDDAAIASILIAGGNQADWARLPADLSARTTFRGGRGADYFRAGGGRDAIEGGPGDDVLLSRSGADVIDGGRGDDRMSAGAGADELIGRRGADVMIGGGGPDVLMGRERLVWSSPDDMLCGRGRDTATRDWRDRTFGCETTAR